MNMKTFEPIFCGVFFKHLLSIFLILIPAMLFAGDDQILELEQQHKTSEGEAKVDLLNRLSDLYIYKNDSLAINYATQSVVLAEEFDFPKELADAYYNLGKIYRSKSQYEKARSYYLQSSEIYTQIKDVDGATLAMRKVGYMFSKEGNYSDARAYYHMALELCTSPEHKPQKAKLLSTIAGAHRLEGEYDKALKFAFDALNIQDEMGIGKDKTFTLDRIGVIYRQQNKYEQALEYYMQSLSIRKALDPKPLRDIAYSNMVIGDLNLELENFDQALFYLNAAQSGYKEIKDEEGLAYVLSYLGIVWRNNGQNKKALNSFNEAISKFEAINNKRGILSARNNLIEFLIENGQLAQASQQAVLFSNQAEELESKLHTSSAWEFKYRIAKAKGHYSDALNYHEAFVLRNDSMWNKEKSLEMAKMELRFQNEVQLRENELLLAKNAENKALIEKQSIQNLTLMFGIFLLMLLGVLLMGLFRQKNKANKVLSLKNEMINQQKKELEEAQKELKEANGSLEAKVRTRTAALNQSHEELEKFVYLASHDLKHPLRNIIGFSQLLSRDLEKKHLLNDSNREYFELIINGTKYMSNVIDDILEFSKFSMARDNKIEVIDFKEVLDQVKSNIKKQTDESGARIVINGMPRDLPGIKIKMVQLFQNLMTNAVKFRRKDKKCKIQVSAVEQDDFWEFSIKDNGIGIEKEHFDIIFELFKQINNKQDYGGSGMGLAISKRIVEQHLGKIWVDSEIGKGTRMFFTIKKGLTQTNQELVEETEKNIYESAAFVEAETL